MTDERKTLMRGDARAFGWALLILVVVMSIADLAWQKHGVLLGWAFASWCMRAALELGWHLWQARRERLRDVGRIRVRFIR